MEKIRNNADKDKTPNEIASLFLKYPETEDKYLAKFPEYWSPYKSAYEKLKYEEDLPIVIQPYLRGYFEHHASEMAELQKEDIKSYTAHLKNAWKQHIEVNKATDCFLNYEVRNPIREWSVNEWQTAKHLLFAGMTTDHTKTMYSAGLKKKLDQEADLLIGKYGQSDPDFRIKLLTPSFPTFYEERDLFDKKYALSVIEGQPDAVLKQHIVDKYNSGDESVFLERFRVTESKSDPIQLKRAIQNIEESFKSRSTEKGYLMLERPDIKDFEELLKFDNTTEYEYTYSLKGLPDLFLREEILRRLIELKAIPADSSVFNLAYGDFEESIDRTVRRLQEEFVIRIRPYRQRYDTCGTACVMSVLNLRGARLTEENELKIWEMVGKPYNFPGGLAQVLLKNKFNVEYVQDKHELLDRNNPEFSSMSPGLVSAAETYVALHEKAVEEGLEFTVSDWDYKRVRSEIEAGNLCLVYLHVTETMSHVVLAHGVSGDDIVIMDPLGGIKRMTEEDMNEQIVHPMGKRLLVVKKLPRDLFKNLNDKLSEVGY